MDMHLEIARLSEQCHRAFNTAMAAGNRELANCLREMGFEIAALMKQLAELEQPEVRP
jgi:hypothetical protein